MITIGFVVSLIFSIIVAGYLVYTNWLSSTEKLVSNISEDISDDIYDRVNNLIHIPEHINDVNHSIITNEILDINNDELRDKFFVHILTAHPDEVYSFSYGTVEGEYYGARRNENGIIEIMKNNASTGGHLWYYEVNEDLNSGELVYEAGKFDPRSRDWYKVAMEKRSPSFSSIYKHFVMDDLTISASWPIYDNQDNLRGVMGAHMLISDIGSYLEEALSKYSGQAVIVERETGLLVANSLSLENFSIHQDGSIKRYGINEVNIQDFKNIFDKYKEDPEENFLYSGQYENLFVNTRSIKFEGLDWVIISALPESLYMSSIQETMIHTTLAVTALFFAALFLFQIFARNLMRPIDELLNAAQAFASGDLTHRVKIGRFNEIGKLSESFNSVANQMSYLIENLEEAVEERTNDLNSAYATITESNQKLELILDSAKEAIVGIDEKGIITFLNRSSLEMLGYENSDELVGADMHSKIHYLHNDGSYFDVADCRIFKSIQQGAGITVDDEVFWRKDGSCFDVEYSSYPQIEDGKVMGAVVTFTDITERKIIEKEINYLTYHDNLTGLYNRTGFEKRKNAVDTEASLPLGVIFGDLNGLKMTNDIFGHEAGDRLLKKAAEVLTKSCRTSDIIARVGGDEFIILLPNTEEMYVQKVLKRIMDSFNDTKIDAIKCSMALGYDLKNTKYQSLEEITANAENKMYKNKTENHSLVNREILNGLIDTLHKNNPEEKRHSINTKTIAAEIAKALKVSESDITKLEKAAYLHDIGKIALKDSDISKIDSMDEEGDAVKQHSTVGFRILTMFEDTMDLADYVYNHHEQWNGNGYPRGIKNDKIPLFSRIISVAEVFERVCFKGDRSLEEARIEAINVIRNESGKRFDPEIVEVFIEIADSIKLLNEA